ncbi:MAG: enoyl-CoA hydratase-related protein [Alphaproteobacteria bacterium]
MASIDTGTDQLLFAIDEGVATITLNRPQARNALSDTLTPALRLALASIPDRADVGAVIITGAGTAFCAGGDVKSMGSDKKAKPRSLDEAAADLRHRQRTLTGVLVGLRVPTIAALPGPAAGAGMALALACDIRIAARSAFVSTGYARVGLSGDYGITWLLTRLVGTARARELMFTARRVDAETCERLGLVNQVVDDDRLQDEVRALATSLAAGPRAAIAAMKDNLDQALSDDFLACLDHEADRMVRVARTDDHREAVRAFIEKRSPNFGAG